MAGQMLGDSGSGVVTPMAYPSSERAEPLSGKDKRKAKDNKRMRWLNSFHMDAVLTNLRSLY